MRVLISVALATVVYLVICRCLGVLVSGLNMGEVTNVLLGLGVFGVFTTVSSINRFIRKNTK